MSANQVTMDYPYRQRYYFPETGQDDYSLSLSGTLDTVFVPLAKAPAGEIKCYLLIGKDTNPETLANASRFEIPVKPADENKLNYDWDIRRNLQAIDPDYIPDFLQVKDDSITGIIASGATGQKLGEAVKQKIIGLYSPKFEGYFFDEQVPDLESSVYGYLSLRSKIYMVNNIGALNYAINQMIDKDDILGYEIVYPYNVQYSRLFEDDTSITSYGRRFKKEGVKNFSNIKSFNLYGKALLAKYTQVVKKGEAMIRYHDGSAFDQTYPLVGKLCDVSCGSFTDWNATDVRIQNVDHTITPTRWTCKITAQRQTTFGKLEALLKALEAKGGEMKSDITTELLIEDTLTLTDNTATATAFTVADMTWSGQSFKEIILQ